LLGSFHDFELELNQREFALVNSTAGSVQCSEILEKLAFARMSKRKMPADFQPGVPNLEFIISIYNLSSNIRWAALALGTIIKQIALRQLTAELLLIFR
jgi:hypothetical protein